MRRWFDHRQVQPNTTLCRVRYGEDMKLAESAQNADPDTAREDAAYLVTGNLLTACGPCPPLSYVMCVYV